MAELEHASEEALKLGDQCPSWIMAKVEKVSNQVKSASENLNKVMRAPTSKPVPMTKDIQAKAPEDLVKAGNNIVGAVSSAVENHARNA